MCRQGMILRLQNTLPAVTGCLLLALTASAQADSESGLAFLEANANAGGGFGTVPARDTYQVLRTFTAYALPPDPLGMHASYLLAEDYGETDLDARVLLGLSLLDEPVSEEVARLVATQGDDGGFGFRPNYPSAGLETALMLQLMAQARYADPAPISNALTFLQTQANEDGGYGYEGTDSLIGVTVEALIAYQAWRDVFDLEEPITAALEALFSTQQDDGGFGTGSHRVLDSAMVLATSTNETVDLDAWTRGMAFLASQQSPSGGSTCAGAWDCDVYTTAWALAALRGVRPDLTATALTIPSGDLILEASTPRVQVEVANVGPGSAPAGALISVSLQAPGDVTTTLLYRAALPALDAHTSTTLAFEWDTTGINGAVYLVAEVDEDDRIDERDETNNERVAGVTVTPRVDLSIDPAEVYYTPENPGATETITLHATARNSGGTDAPGVVVRFYRDPDGDDVLIAEQRIDLATGAGAAVEAETTLSLGTHIILIVIDPDDAFDEGIETNNSAELAVEVVPRVDLLLSSDQVTVYPEEVLEPDRVKVSATVFNAREDPAENVRVRLTLYDSDTMDSLDEVVQVAADQTIASIPGNGSATVEFSAATAGYPGSNYFMVEADPEDTIRETREDNNVGQAAISIIEQGNLNVTSTDLSIPSSTYEGNSINIHTTLRNTGGGTLEDIVVRFTADGPNGSTIEIGRQQYAELPGYTYATTPDLVWDTTGLSSGAWTITVTLDPENTVTERDETDNTASRSITVNPRPDLAVSAGELTFSPSPAEEGDEVTLTAVVRNLTARSSSGCVLRFYDGSPDGGGTQIGEDLEIPAISGNGDYTASTLFDTVHQAGERTIFVQVDATDLVDEFDETNNVASHVLTVVEAYRPDLEVRAQDLRLTPDNGVPPGEDVLISATVHNLRNFAADGVTVRLYDGDPVMGGQAIASDQVVAVPALGATSVTFTWTTPATRIRAADLYVAADADDAYDEPDEDNNTGVIQYRGRAGAETTPLDLVATVDYHDVTLNWSAPSDTSTLSAYRAYRNGTLLNPTGNVTDTATATADSAYNSSYPPDKAIDDSTSTYWRSASHSAPWYFELSLAEPVLVSRIDIAWYSSYRGRDYEIQGWDGTAWQPLIAVLDNSTNTVSHTVETYMVTDRVRIYVTRGYHSSYVAIYEVDVHGATPLLDRHFTDLDVYAGTYRYTVTSFLEDGFESPDSGEAVAQVAPPRTVAGLQAATDYTQVSLSWQATAEPGLRSYLVFRDGTLLAPQTEVAEGTASAVSEGGSSYAASKAIDGNPSSYWRSSSSSGPWWWQVDYDQPKLITEIDIQWHSSYRGEVYEIQGWDGRRWATLISMTGNTENTVVHPLVTPFPTGAIRILVTESHNASYCGIYEVTLFETPERTGTSFVDDHLRSGPYQYDVAVLDYLGEVGDVATVVPSVPPPIPPGSLSLTLAENEADLTWSAVDNPAMMTYLAYRDGTLLYTSADVRDDATASAVSEASSSYAASKAIDDSTSSYWRTSSSSSPWWWQMDFQDTWVFTGITLAWHSSYRGVDYEIQGFDGTYWRTLARVTNNSANTVTHGFDTPFAGNRVRVYITESTHDSYVGLYDIHIDGFAPRNQTQFHDEPVPGGAHAYAISVLDRTGEESVPRMSNGDVVLPPPSSLTASVDGDNVSLQWSASSSANLAGYFLYQDEALLNPPGDENVALYGEADASSTRSSGYAPDKAIDDSTSTYWVGESGLPRWTWQVRFDTPHLVAGVEMLWNSSYYATDYQVQALLDGEWVTVATETGNVDYLTEHVFGAAVTTEAIRLVIQAVRSSYPYLAEFRAYAPGPITARSWIDYNVASGSYRYAVTAVDVFGGESERAEATATVGNVLPPTNLQASVNGNQVSLTWSASATSDIRGYTVYRDDYRVNADTDAAPLATPSASSSYSSSYPPNNAIDGNDNSYWRSASGSSWTFELAWPEVRKFDRVSLYWNSSGRGEDYDIESWDGSKWVVEYRVTGNNRERVEYSLPRMAATDRIRIKIVSTNAGYAAIRELDAIEPELVTGTSYTDDVIDNGTYTYTVVAVSDLFTSGPSNLATATVEETTPPSRPTGLTTSVVTTSSISLSWNQNPEPDIFRYHLYFEDDPEPIAVVNGTTYTHSNVISSDRTEYAYALTAVDRNGNESAPDTYTFAPAPPAPPAGLTARVQGPDVLLQWSLADDEVFRDAIIVYRDGDAITNTLAPDTTEFLDLHVPRGVHHYQVSARDLFQREGARSNEATVEVNGTDLAVSDEDIFFLPQRPSEFDVVTLNVVVTNDGEDPTEAMDVVFYDGDPDTDGILLGTTTIPALDAGEMNVASLDWDLEDQAGDHTITAIVDPNDVLTEFYEDNNRGSKPLHVDAIPVLEVVVRDIDSENFPDIVVYVGVEDSTGQAVTNLDESHFQLLEDDVAQAITEVVYQGGESASTPMVDLVSLIDTSGSMNEEWTALPQIMEDVKTQMILRGIDARVVNYGLAGSPSDAFETLSTGIFQGQAVSIGSEDWGPATTWAATAFAWRPNAVRIVVPVSDEACYGGDGEDSNDLASLQEAIDACLANEVTAFPLWGDGASSATITEALTLGQSTEGDAFEYTEYKKIVDAITLSVLTKVASYTVFYTTNNPARDGALREVDTSARYRNASGEDRGEYTAPSSGVADLAAVAFSILPANPVAGDSAQLSGTVHNYGSETVDAVVQLYQGEGTQLPLGPEMVLKDLEPAAEASFTRTWLALPGTQHLTMVVDPKNLVNEFDESNNERDLVLVLPGAARPELAVSGDSFMVSPATPFEGDQVILSARVYNLGPETSHVLVQFYEGDYLEGGSQIGEDILIETFSALTSKDVAVTWNSSARDGDNLVQVVVDPMDWIAEVHEDNNVAQQVVTVTPKAVQVVVSTGRDTYQADDDMVISGEVVNRESSAFSGVVDLFVQDPSGALVAELDPIDPIEVAEASFSDWPVFVPVTIAASTIHRAGSYVSAPVTLDTLLRDSGLEGIFDLDSFRVAEFDGNGRRLAYWTPRFVPGPGYDGVTQTSGTLLWPTLPSDQTSGDRTFRVYFDVTDNGPRDPIENDVVAADILVLGTDQGGVHVATRGEDGRYTAFTRLDDFNSRICVGTGDVNEDGNEDIVVFDYYRDGYLFAGNGDSTFAARTTLFEDSSSGHCAGVFVLDADQDGSTDILVLDRSHAPTLWHNNGHQAFTPNLLWETPGAAYSADMADLNMDGYLDLIVGVDNGVVYYYLGQENGSFAPPATACYTPGANPYGLAVADFDDDGNIDIIANHSNTGKVYYCRGGATGTGFFPAETLAGVSTPTYAAFADLDYNADGHRDLLVVTYNDPRTVLMFAGRGDFTFDWPETLDTLDEYALSAAASGGLEFLAQVGAPEENLPSSTTFSTTWNTGATFEGTYQVLAILTQDGDERSRSLADFDILADRDLSAEVTTDRPSYSAPQLVSITAQLRNTTVNADLISLEGTISVFAPDGTTVATDTFSRDTLAAGETLTWHTYWLADAFAGGIYTVMLDADAYGGAATNAETTFEVLARPGIGLVGDIAAAPQQMLPGEQLTLDWEVTNNTRSTLENLALQLILSPADQETIIAQSALGRWDIEVSETAGGAETMDTSGLEMGSYHAVLQAYVNDDWASLALADFMIVNLAGTLDASPLTVEGGVDQVTLAYTLSNLSDTSLDDVGFRIEIRDETGATVQTFREPPDTLDPAATWTGTHDFPSSALHLGAHVAALIATVNDITFELVTTSFEVVDTIPPVSSIVITGPYVEQDGTFYMTSSTTGTIRISAEDNFSGVETVWVSDNGATPGRYTPPLTLAEGTHTLTFYAQDLAGNEEAPESITIVVDDSGPEVTVSGVSDGGCVVEEAHPVAEATDASPSTLTSTLDGVPYDGTPVTEPGTHILEVEAQDVIGNTTTTTVTFTIETGDCACLTGDDAADLDGDGFKACEGDCDDNDPFTYPGAEEMEDGADNDCDGDVDEDICPTDEDRDGIATAGGDCNDNDPDIRPGALEIPDDGIDNDCDGEIDEPEQTTEDIDYDGVTVENGDCNDKDTRTHPAASEAPADGRDNDCDGMVDETRETCDGDRDGFTALEGDCDPENGEVYPGALEVCDNGIDDDCNGAIDEGCAWTPTPLPTPTASPTTTPMPTPTPPADVGGEAASETPASETGGGEGCTCSSRPPSPGRTGGGAMLMTIAGVALLAWRRRATSRSRP